MSAKKKGRGASAPQCAPVSPVPGAVRTALAAALVDGRLPLGLDAALEVDDLGLFSVARITVIDCPVLVTDGASGVNDVGRAICQTLRELGSLCTGTGWSTTANIPKALLARQTSQGALYPAWCPTVPTANEDSPLPRLADALVALLANGSGLSRADLFQTADEVFGGGQAAGAYTAALAYDAAEAALHARIIGSRQSWRISVGADEATRIVGEIANLAGQLPTRTSRDSEVDDLQQFSTPAELAYVMAWIAGIEASDVVLEPSAGTGALAAFTGDAASVHVNEISPRRLGLLRWLGFDRVTAENAEHIHNIMHERVAPTVVLMNPPFARSARCGSARVPTAAADHVVAALKLLKPGGRLVAVVGAKLNEGQGSLLDRIRQLGTVRASVRVAGAAFARQGTTVDTRVLVIDKARDATGVPVVGLAQSMDDLVRILAPVQRVRDTGEDARYAPYVPALDLPGSHPHPELLVESRAMAAVRAPVVTYRPAFKQEVWTEGRLSRAQLECVLSAGQVHQRWITGPHGVRVRKGYYVADGTGSGKGREAAGVLWDNVCAGRTRHVWISKDATKLLRAAKRDYAAVGGNPAELFALNDYSPGDVVDRARGVMFVSFGTLRSTRGARSRLDQIIEWLGDDFDGVVVIDEAHRAGECVEVETGVGVKKPSQTALAVIDIQHRLPAARVIYLSATGASEVKNLLFCDRLGIYGPGTAFPTKQLFLAEIEASGLAGMEIVARDLKQLGVMCARSLSFAGVGYERLVHHLTDDQIALYDTLALGWRTVFRNLENVLHDTGANACPGARASALAQFWAGQQRFWGQVLIALQMPSVIAAIERDQAEGHASVIQLVNTLEAALDRALAQEGAIESLDDLDLTPRQILCQYLENVFPTTAYEEYIDGDGITRSRPVQNSRGDVVRDADALAARDKLLVEIGALAVPDGPIEMILDHFGADAVAEITGRSRRVVQRPNKDGVLVRQIEPRSEAKRLAEMDEFANDQRRILIFSGAGGTGVDYHASKAIKNQRLRKHYILQAGWNAKEAWQGLGRTHRTYQAQPPWYVLVATNLRGQMRFLTSIARRLAQLGALTRGQKDAATGQLFSERDNLETGYGALAIMQMVTDLNAGETIAGLSLAEFQEALGLRVLDEHGTLTVSKLPPVRQFLNRVLSLPVALQNDVFDEFADRHDDLVQAAIDKGEYAQGLEVYRADRIETVAAPRTVHVHAESGAETAYVHLRAWRRRRPRPFASVDDGWDGRKRPFVGWFRDAGGKVVGAVAARNRTDDGGRVRRQVRLIGPFSERFEDRGALNDASRFSAMTEQAALQAWDAEIAETEAWESRDLHLITGAILPVWDRIEGSYTVYRISTETGDEYLGRVIAPGQVRATLARLGAGLDTSWAADEAMDAVLAGHSLDLANGWSLRRSRVASEWRVELIGWRPETVGELVAQGLLHERINYKSRLFVPVSKAATLGALLQRHPVVTVTGGKIAA